MQNILKLKQCFLTSCNENVKFSVYQFWAGMDKKKKRKTWNKKQKKIAKCFFQAVLVCSPLRPARTERRVSGGPGTRQSPAAAPGSPPRSWSRPRCVSAGCGGSPLETAGRSGPEPWPCSGCEPPGGGGRRQTPHAQWLMGNLWYSTNGSCSYFLFFLLFIFLFNQHQTASLPSIINNHHHCHHCLELCGTS